MRLSAFRGKNYIVTPRVPNPENGGAVEVQAAQPQKGQVTMNNRYANMFEAVSRVDPSPEAQVDAAVALADRMNDQVVALREKVAYLEDALKKARIERDLLLDIVKGRK